MKIIKKAFQVYHDGMLNENPYEGYIKSELPIYYAKTAGKAKSICSELHDFKIDGRTHKYTDIKSIRAKDYDVILFEGKEMKRYRLEKEIECREKENKIIKLNDDEYYYIQDSRNYVGNAVLWHGLNGNGYVTDLKKAHKYSKKEVLEVFLRGRDTDIIWIGSHVEKSIREYVDMQGLDRLEYSF